MTPSGDTERGYDSGDCPVWGSPKVLSAIVGHEVPEPVWQQAALFGRRIIIVREKAKEVTESGLYKPDVREELTRGWVLALGPQADLQATQGAPFTREALIGAKVNFGGYCGTGLVGDDDHPRLHTLYMVMDIADLWGFNEPESFGRVSEFFYATPDGVMSRNAEEASSAD